MKRDDHTFEDRLERIQDTTGEHTALSERYPLLSQVELTDQDNGEVVRHLHREGRGFLRRGRRGANKQR